MLFECCEEDDDSLYACCDEEMDFSANLQMAAIKDCEMPEIDEVSTWVLAVKKGGLYESLVNDQNVDGSYSMKTIEDLKLEHEEKPEDLKKMGLGSEDAVWATIIVLAVFEKMFKAREGEWMLIASKAKSYLKKQGIKTNLSTLISLALAK